jgi:hypothetical protein
MIKTHGSAVSGGLRNDMPVTIVHLPGMSDYSAAM